jgi:hypothetical protein
MKVNCCPAPVEEAITFQTSGRATMLGASLLTAAPDRCRGKTISEGPLPPVAGKLGGADSQGSGGLR